jgi:hypothetical protein
MYDLIFPGTLILLWVAIRVMLPSVAFDFDFDNAHATFVILLDKYLWIARGLVMLDVLLALLPASRVVSDMPSHCCLAGAVSGILFCVWMITQYEVYVANRYPRGASHLGQSTYTASKRAVTLALGWGMVLFTVVGLLAVLA